MPLRQKFLRQMFLKKGGLIKFQISCSCIFTPFCGYEPVFRPQISDINPWDHAWDRLPDDLGPLMKNSAINGFRLLG
jgi:hypothetical protein